MKVITADHVQVAADLRAACGLADIVICANGSTEILVRGEWSGPVPTRIFSATTMPPK